MNFFTRLKESFLKLNIAQQISLGVLAICIPALVTISVNAMVRNAEYMDALANASSSEASSISSEESFPSSSSEETSSFEESSSAEPVEIFLKPSSVEEDLEVQIVDIDGKMVTGYDFILTVKGKDSNYISTWTVNDGFLRLTKIDGGEYTVTIEEAEGYIITETTVEITVKEKVKYEKVDVADKIKDETEIDVSKEDTVLAKPVATPEPTPQIPTYENKNASVSEKVTEYKYKASKISKGDFAEENVGYLFNKDGSKSIYIAKVDENGFIVGDIRILKDTASSSTQISEAAVISTAFLDENAVWDYELRKTYYNGSYVIKPLNLVNSVATIDDITGESSSSVIESSPSESILEVIICPDCNTEKSEACAAAYCTKCVSHAGHTADAHCSKCSSLEHTADAHCTKCDGLDHSADAHCSSCGKLGHTDNTSTDCENYTSSITSSENSSSESSSEENSSSDSISSDSITSDSTNTDDTSTDSTSSDNTSSDSTSDNTSGSSSEQTPQKPSFESAVKADIYDSNSAKLKDSILSILDITENHKTEKVYNGGWNEDKTSYYLNDGTKVKGQVIIGGTTYNFDSDGIVVRNIAKGIDVSKYQPNVNWSQVKASGVDYVIIRVGYRGYGSGVMVEDPYFKSHISGAKAAGLKVGVYFYSQAITVEEAVEEASMAIQLCNGYGLQYPIYFDTEATGTGVGRADGLSKTQRTAIANAFCQTVRNSGYKAGVYASKSWFYYQLDYSQLSQYDIWLAHYTSATDFSHRYDMWQYTGSGSCPGINGAVDLNWAYKVY